MTIVALRGAERLGAFRGPLGESGPFKEWMHVCATGHSGFILLNFSFERPEGCTAQVRAVVLAHVAGRHIARILEPSSAGPSFHPGRTSAHIAGCGFSWIGDRAWLTLDTGDGVLTGKIDLQAIATAACTHSIPMMHGRDMGWIVAPRWEVTSGTISLHGESIRVDAWQAYHDHNWGHFSWSDDFSWEWAFGFPDDRKQSACVVFGRLTDRVCARVVSRVLMVWWAGRQLRTFRGKDVNVDLIGEHRVEACHPIPGICRLLMPRRLTGVPVTIAVHARHGQDELHAHFTTTHAFRVGVPSDGELTGIRILHEQAASVACWGRVAGHDIQFDGLGGSELLRHA